MSFRAIFAQSYEDAKVIRRKFEQSNFFKSIKHKKTDMDSSRAYRGVVLANGLYLWLANSLLFTHLKYIVPYYFQDYDPWTVYYIKVLAVFLYVQCMANWACAKYYSSAYRLTRDQPFLQKTLWDDFKSPYRIPNYNENGTLSLNGNGHSNGHAKNGDVLIETGEENLEKKDLSWHWCTICQYNAPPRSHHCSVCNSCILKRDHHCFLLGTCIGYYNQRYFIVLSFYMIFTCFPGIYFTYCYLYDHFTASHWVDYFLPVTMYRYVWSETVNFQTLCMISHMSFLWIGGAFGMGFFIGQVVLVYTGKTAYEFMKDLRVRSTDSVKSHLNSVFGNFWWFNIILPAVIMFRQPDNGTQWPSMKTF